MVGLALGICLGIMNYTVSIPKIIKTFNWFTCKHNVEIAKAISRALESPGRLVTHPVQVVAMTPLAEQCRNDFNHDQYQTLL